VTLPVAGSAILGVVCDLDGVLRRFDDESRTQLELEYGLPPGTLAARAFSLRLLYPAITGAVTDAVWRDSVAADLHDLLDSESARLIVARWSTSIGRVDLDVRNLLRAVRANTPVVALTNATTRLMDDLDVLGARAEFDAIVSSAITGCPKPEPGAFQTAQVAVAQLLGRSVEPSDLLFIDDSAGHVAAAAQLGWNAFHYRDAEGLALVLADHGLLRNLE
jgi:putative hydrolase of the HAD superfamily